MKKRSLDLLLLTSLFVAPAISTADEPPLIQHMKDLQYFMHKTALALDARNLELVKFYAHEIEETIEEVEEVEKFKDYNVEKMIKATLEPEFEKFEDLVDDKKLDRADSQFNKMIEACNQCHGSVKYAFIKIKRVTVNPYMQSFEQ